ncbi:MAG: GFA family protein [Hyphomicrobiaceae bacterium]
MTTRTPRTGGCQCGAVRFACTGEPARIGACHCRMCQKALGAPCGIYAVYPAAQVTWTAGQPATWASSNVASRGFCAGCGTPLTYQSADGATIDILSIVFDDPADLGPTYAIGIESKQPWADGLAALPARTTGDNIGAAAAALIVSRQCDPAP